MRRSILFIVASIVAPSPVRAQEPAVPGEDLFPLAVGNVWTYKVVGQEERFVVRAVRQEMVGSQTCILLEATLRDRVVATEHLAFTKAGLSRFRADKEDVEPPVLMLKLPANRGFRWTAKYQLGGRSTTAGFRQMIPEDVTVPAGKYKALTVQADMGESGGWVSSKVWYVTGVGPVKQTIFEGKRPTPLVLELEKFVRGDAK